MKNFSILYFGMPSGGELSRQPLAALLQSGFQIAAVIIPGLSEEPEPTPLDPPEIDPAELNFVPMVSQHLSPSIVTTAWEHKIPLLAIGDLRHPAARATLAAFQPELICVSCFARIIPPPILTLPTRGAINLHPALLPRYRGPWPLFWQFKNGESRSGVTLHYMNDKLDAGDILRQTEIELPDGIEGRAVELQCAELGAQLMVAGATLIRDGAPPRRPQLETDATYYPLPARSDLTLSTDQPARQAFNFIQGAATLIGAACFEINAGDQIFQTRAALRFAPEEQLAQPYRRENGSVTIQFSPGTLTIPA
jgi:methionyl-tRNA formyltransferase